MRAATRLPSCGHGLTLRLAHSTKGAAAWNSFTVFLPTEIEVLGAQTYGDELIAWNTSVQYPIYAKSGVFRIKRFNGARAWWWEGTPAAATSANFAHVYNDGNSSAGHAAGGVAPLSALRSNALRPPAPLRGGSNRKRTCV